MEDRDLASGESLSSFIVIPARLASTRLPRKLLLRETGRTLLEHTYRSASRATLPCGICVAAGDPEIVQEVIRFGGSVRRTDPHAASGTDRVAEVARQLPGIDVIVNVQGDEPEVSAGTIDLSVKLLQQNPQAVMSTLATPIRSRQHLYDASCVKVVFDAAGRALYFSRSPIPYVPRSRIEALLQADPPVFYLHVGVYAYRRDFLVQLAGMPQSLLEQLESLEQLRVLAAGHRIQVGTIDENTVGIDTREDYDAFVHRVRLRKSA